MSRLDDEHDNLRAARSRLLSTGNIEKELRVCMDRLACQLKTTSSV